MVLNKALLIDKVFPVCLEIGAVTNLVLDVRNVESLVTVRVCAAADDIFISAVAVLHSLVLILDISIGIHHVVGLGRLYKADVHVISNLGFTLAALLGGDDDNTACSTGTVKGCCSCVLKDIDGEDVGGVDVGKGVGLHVAGIHNTGLDGNSVHNVQRICTAGNGADTTDENLCLSTCTCVRSRYLDTGCLALEH